MRGCQRCLDSLALLSCFRIAGRDPRALAAEAVISRQPRLVDGERLPVSQDHSALNDVLKLANISRPVVGAQQLESPSVDVSDLLSHLLRVALDEVLDE